MSNSHLLHISLVFLVGCGGSTFDLRGTERAVGADGSLVVEEEGANREVTLTVEHLPPPRRVAADSQGYAVWILPSGRDAVFAGRLDYDPDDRTGTARMVTPHREFEVLVTAEEEDPPNFPSSEVIFRQPVS